MAELALNNGVFDTTLNRSQTVENERMTRVHLPIFHKIKHTFSSDIKPKQVGDLLVSIRL
jgi:hypothetical protein